MPEEQITTVALVLGMAASSISPLAGTSVLSQVPPTVIGQPPAPSGTSIDLMLAVWIGGAIIGGIVSALTFIFRLFLRSRDSTETTLTKRVEALEAALTKSQERVEGMSTRLVDLLQGVVRENAEATRERAHAIAAQAAMLKELVDSIHVSRVQDAEEHTRLLGAVSNILATYTDTRGPSVR